ncbi:hypothetical protein [uncultured Adlercreutzia sp.]|uniref:hypothetical protein n=1 Tax=uncultured Adlercreutzia sp. TaxID=875803 RepID=UPI002676036B|nr:hypothetical protein [uncultured Adlercreutzia sp.]
MDKAIKGLMGLIFALIIVVAVFGILPQMGVKLPFGEGVAFENPLSGLLENGKNAAANAALDATGLKGKAKAALEGNRDKIAAATGMSDAEVDAAIAALDIDSWEVTSLPEGATETGSSSISYGGTDATITTYDDPSVVTVNAMGQNVTLAVPDSAQSYLPFLGYLG